MGQRGVRIAPASNGYGARWLWRFRWFCASEEKEWGAEGLKRSSVSFGLSGRAWLHGGWRSTVRGGAGRWRQGGEFRGSDRRVPTRGDGTRRQWCRRLQCDADGAFKARQWRCSPSPAASEHLALKLCALSTESKM